MHSDQRHERARVMLALVAGIHVWNTGLDA